MSGKRLCKWLGHTRPRRGWWGDGLYGRVADLQWDGTGRSHFSLYLACGCCGQEFRAGRFHGHSVTLLLKEDAELRRTKGVALA